MYIFGGQCEKDVPSNGVYRIHKNDPTKMEKVAQTVQPRIDPIVMLVGNNVVVVGGSTIPLLEAFDSVTWKPVTGLEAKSASFFTQLACYTSDLKLENSSSG